jgi:hypothetical protein
MLQLIQGILNCAFRLIVTYTVSYQYTSLYCVEDAKHRTIEAMLLYTFMNAPHRLLHLNSTILSVFDAT